MIKGTRVVRASGSRRVRKRVEAWRYVLEMCEGCRADVDDDREDIDEARMLGAKPTEAIDMVAVGLAAVKEPFGDIGCDAVQELELWRFWADQEELRSTRH